MNEGESGFSPDVQAVIDEFIPICRKLAAGRGRYAISIGGSRGKGTADSRSDVDFRLFHEEDLPVGQAGRELWKDCSEAIERWGRKGIIIDGVWPRKIGQIDAALDRWLDGEIRPDEMFWTIWGYYVLPDIYHQAIVEDPYDVISGWKRRLQSYPPQLKKAVLDKYLASMRYWRNDYHYLNKVRRGDIVFLAGLSAKMVHELIQILFALNETYYVGDGQNLDFVRKFRLAPPEFPEKVKQVLYPPAACDALQTQYEALASLIDEVTQLAEATIS